MDVNGVKEVKEVKGVKDECLVSNFRLRSCHIAVVSSLTSLTP